PTSSTSAGAGRACRSPWASGTAAGRRTCPSTPCRSTRRSCGSAASPPRWSAWCASRRVPGAGSSLSSGRGRPREKPRCWRSRPPTGLPRPRRRCEPRGSSATDDPTPDGLRLVELVRLLFERFLGRRLRRQDAIEVLDLLVLLVVLEILLELHLLAHEGALGVRAQVGRLGRGREADLAVVGRVLERLADDQADVLVAEARDAGRVLVAVGHELEQTGGDPGFDDTDAHAVAVRDQPVLLGRQFDGVARVDLGQLLGGREVGQ